jgi:hypothetical protein
MQRLIGLAPLTFVMSSVAAAAHEPALPKVDGPIPNTSTSHAFLSSDHLKQPIDLSKYGYIEEEYLISGDARVFGWPDKSDPPVLATGGYTTRILVRRPKDGSKFNGTAIVEPMNPSSPVDLPIMWAESYKQFMADGYAWVGITIKPNTIKALKKFDPARYAAVAMPQPQGGPTCASADINSWAQPTTPDDEVGLAWDIIGEVGALLKTKSDQNPLSRPAARLYMTGQSQTAGYARTYATFFGRTEKGPDGGPLYDGYLYSGSPPGQVPISQCAKGFSPGDPRLLTGPAGVPVIELFAQSDIGTNIETRRPDSDKAPDLYRRYEVAGAPHVDPWEQKSFASEADTLRASGQADAIAEANCEPKDVTPSDFPTRYVFDAAWRILDNWVRVGTPAPHAPRLELKPDAASHFLPDKSFVVDQFGNAKGGVRTPYVDVPTARWIGAKTPAFQCMFEGYKFAFDGSTLRKLYPTHDAYVAKVRRSAETLQRQKWLTPTDAAAIVQEAEQAKVP